MNKVFKTQNAEILTTSVSIRTILIEEKQVSLAIFRQLLEEDIVDWHTCTFRGVGWGYVNYFWRGCVYAWPDAIHLVWQKNNELRRCLILRENGSEKRDQLVAPLFELPQLFIAV